MNQTRDSFSALPVRLRRGLFGFRTADVAVALAQLGHQLDGLAASVDRLYRERESLRGLVDGARAEQERLLVEQAARLETEAAERVAIERARADQHVAEAQAQGAQIVAEAHEQASILRHEAGRRVGDEASRLEDLLRVREQLLGELRGLVQGYSALLGGHEGIRESSPQPAAEPQAVELSLPAAVSAPDAAGGLYPAQVELDVGPFGDFSELSAFERALARLPKVDDVYIRGFGDERATIELSLTEETPLAHDLERRLPYGLRLERDGHAKLVVDLHARVATGGRG